MLQAISVIASILFSFLLLGAVLVILNDNQDSGRKIAWILIIGILPVIGLILYFVFGLNFRKPGFFKLRNREFLNVFDERAGEQTKELLFGGYGERVAYVLGDIAFRYAFISEPIYKLEIAAESMMHFLLERFVGAAILYDTGEYMTEVQQKLIALISDNYMAIYNIYSKGKSEEEKLYLRLLLVTDSICGMTDSYAKRLYQELSGIL